MTKKDIQDQIKAKNYPGKSLKISSLIGEYWGISKNEEELKTAWRPYKDD